MAHSAAGMPQVIYDTFVDEYANEYARLFDRPAAEFKAAIDTPEKLMQFAARLHGDED